MDSCCDPRASVPSVFIPALPWGHSVAAEQHTPCRNFSIPVIIYSRGRSSCFWKTKPAGVILGRKFVPNIKSQTQQSDVWVSEAVCLRHQNAYMTQLLPQRSAEWALLSRRHVSGWGLSQEPEQTRNYRGKKMQKGRAQLSTNSDLHHAEKYFPRGFAATAGLNEQLFTAQRSSVCFCVNGGGESASEPSVLLIRPAGPLCGPSSPLWTLHSFTTCWGPTAPGRAPPAGGNLRLRMRRTRSGQVRCPSWCVHMKPETRPEVIQHQTVKENVKMFKFSPFLWYERRHVGTRNI